MRGVCFVGAEGVTKQNMIRNLAVFLLGTRRRQAGWFWHQAAMEDRSQQLAARAGAAVAGSSTSRSASSAVRRHARQSGAKECRNRAVIWPMPPSSGRSLGHPPQRLNMDRLVGAAVLARLHRDFACAAGQPDGMSVATGSRCAAQLVRAETVALKGPMLPEVSTARTRK
jgi:hypothetical protein